MFERTLGTLLCMTLIAAAVPAMALAQQGGGLVVDSVPPGAVVELLGPTVLRGVTP